MCGMHKANAKTKNLKKKKLKLNLIITSKREFWYAKFDLTSNTSKSQEENGAKKGGNHKNIES